MDLDDTLLRDDLTISPRVVRAIQAAREQGVVATIATGRTPVSMKRYAEQLGIDVPVITFHGALIQQALSGEILFRRTISNGLAGEIVAELLSKGLHVQLYIGDRIFVQEENEWSASYARMSHVAVEKTELRPLLLQNSEGVEKILLIGEETDLDALAPSLRESYGDKIHLTKSKSYFLELTDIGVNKGVALDALAKRFEITREEIMAIGDSFNDLEMIRYAGLGVAMGNARPEVREVADVITTTNEEDGVAEAIERYVLIPRPEARSPKPEA